MRLLSLLSVFLLAAYPALAQEATVLTPGHPDLALDEVTLDGATLEVRIVEPRTQSIGTVTETVTREGQFVTVVTDTNVPMAGQVSKTTTRYMWPSLAPVSLTLAGANRTGTVEFDGAQVTGTYGQGEWAPLPFEITLDTPAFPPDAVAVLARALPFREGYTATVPTFAPDQRLREVTLTVVGREDVQRPDGSTVSAWVVEESSTGRGAQERRHLIDPETRDRLQTMFTPQEGTVIVIAPAPPSDEAAAPAGTLRPGTPPLATDALRDYDQSYVVRVVEPVQQDVGTASRRLTVNEAAGTVTLVTTVSVPMAGQMQTDSLVAVYPTLAPISQTSTGSGGTTTLTYADGRVTGTRTPTGGEAEAIDVPLTEPVFDASWLSEVARLLPLAEGYRAVLPTYSPASGVTNVELTVIGQETVGGYTAWIVEATPAEGPGSTLAVDVETRKLLRTQIQPQIGVLVEIVPE